MKNELSEIDLSNIPKSPRYLYTVDYIFTNPYYTVAAFEKEDFETGYHVQEFYEICIISKGSGYHFIEDTCVKASLGDVFIVPPGRKHAFVGGKGFNVYFIHLSPKFLMDYTPKMKAMPSFLALFEIEPLMRANGATYRHLYLDSEAMKEVSDILYIASNKHQHTPDTMLIWESYIVIALTILCREYEKLQSKVGKNANNDKLFVDSIVMILDKYNTKLTIESLAQIAGLSRTAYIEKFREAMGTSPRHFIMAERIKAAKWLLAGTDKPIAKIAEEVGFYDTSHFNKCFSAAEGLSPSEYRRTK